MSDIIVPHFDYPFRLSGGVPVVNEQDSVDDVTACVASVLLFRPGQRELLPEFGTPEFLFQEIPIDKSSIIEGITTWEPRSVTTIEESPDAYDPMIDHIAINVSVGAPT